MPVVNWQQTLRHHGWTNSWTRCSVLRTSIAASPCSDFRKRTDDHHRSAVASLATTWRPWGLRQSRGVVIASSLLDRGSWVPYDSAEPIMVQGVSYVLAASWRTLRWAGPRFEVYV